MPRGNVKSVAEKICFVSNSRNSCLARALYESILDEDLNQIEFLLKCKGSDANYLIEDFGITPLHCAVGTGSEDHAFKVVSFILCYGGNPNVRCIEGTSPVLIAACWGRLNILKLLLAHGGNPQLIDDEGNNALDYAKLNKHYNIISYLKKWSRSSSAIGSPSVCRNDAVTQTTIRSLDDIPVEQTTISDGFISCDAYYSEDNNSFSNTTLSISPQSPSILYETPPKSKKNIKSPSSNFSVTCNSGVSILERGFICENTSDLFSDIDSNIDLQNSVSIFNYEDDVNNVCNSNNGINESVTNLVNEGVVAQNEFDVINCKADINDSFSSYASCLSQNPQDIAFIGSLPEESLKPIEELYTDDEAGIVLLQRNFPPDHSDSDNSLKSKKSVLSNCSADSYDTDNLTNKLKECKIFSGPVTKTTKKVYVRQLKNFIKSEKLDTESNKFTIGSVLSRTFTDNYLKLIEQWSPLENQMSEDFLKNSVKYKFRGGIAKCFFNYLLMDPSITGNLPLRAKMMDSLDVWKVFINAIFYVGKGKQSRPYAHLYEALKPSTRKPLSKKILKVLDIWNSQQGVVCLMIFHNVISAEALTREAAMIDVLSEANLTNAQNGEYHGIASSWNMKQKCQLGAVLLHRALNIYLAEGERQISPPDLEARPNFYKR